MDKIWSEKIMGIENLDLIRNLRFHKNNSQVYLNFLPIHENKCIVDIGCGTGALTRAIYDWFNGNISINGIDYDEGYIDYCKLKSTKEKYNIEFNTGDACNLEFSNSSYDFTISSSVIEHVDNVAFLNEQYRILKEKGYMIIMNVYGYKENTGNIDQYITISEEEKILKHELEIYLQENIRKPLNRFLLHRKPIHVWLNMMKEKGFKNIQHNIVKVCNFVDNVQEKAFSKMIIDNFFSNDLDMIWGIENNSENESIITKTKRLKYLLEERKTKRIELFEKGIEVWDSIETDTNILMGQK